MRTDSDYLFIAIVIPDFEAQVAACWDYTLWNQPYVITRQNTGHDRSAVISVSEYAKMMGIYAGMRIQKVKRSYSNVKVIREDISRQEQAGQEMITVCREFTPEPDPHAYTDVLLLDMSGSRRCYGKMHDRLGELVQQQLQEQIGFKHVNIGTAGTAFTARLCALAAGPNEVKVCEPGFESLVIADMKSSFLPG